MIGWLLPIFYDELATSFETVWMRFHRVIIRDQGEHPMFTFFEIVELKRSDM